MGSREFCYPEWMYDSTVIYEDRSLLSTINTRYKWVIMCKNHCSLYLSIFRKWHKTDYTRAWMDSCNKSGIKFRQILRDIAISKNNTAVILPFEIHPQSSADSENVFNSRVRLNTISNPALNDIISSRSAISVAKSGKDAETRRYAPHRHEHLDSKNLPNVVLEENSSEF